MATLSKANEAELLEHVRAGVPPAVAAQAVGIDGAGWDKIVERGELAGKQNARFRAFARSLDIALAEAEVAMVDLVVRAARRGSTAAATWLLERHAPERWVKPDQRSAPNGDSSTAEGGKEDVTQDIRDELAARRAAAEQR